QHHKHTYHLIAHAQIEGFDPTEREVIAQVARYHRRSSPRKKHAPWAALPASHRETVRQLAALLRVADALDRRHTRSLRELTCRVSRGRVVITLDSDQEMDVEMHAADEKGELMREVFGVQLEFERKAVPRKRLLRAVPYRARIGATARRRSVSASSARRTSAPTRRRRLRRS